MTTVCRRTIVSDGSTIILWNKQSEQVLDFAVAASARPPADAISASHKRARRARAPILSSRNSQPSGAGTPFAVPQQKEAGGFLAGRDKRSQWEEEGRGGPACSGSKKPFFVSWCDSRRTLFFRRRKIGVPRGRRRRRPDGRGERLARRPEWMTSSQFGSKKTQIATFRLLRSLRTFLVSGVSRCPLSPQAGSKSAAEHARTSRHSSSFQLQVLLARNTLLTFYPLPFQLSLQRCATKTFRRS